MKTFLSLSLIGLSLAVVAWAEDEPSGSAELAKVSLGEHWYGENVGVDDLKGRVTLIEFWGYN